MAFTRSNGRIPIEDSTAGILSGGNSFNINENTDPLAIPRGTISFANPYLLPEISDNWDFELTYYTDSGGKVGASYYTKSVKNFSDTVTTETDPPWRLQAIRRPRARRTRLQAGMIKGA